MIKTPAGFLFDEPLSNLDAKLRAQMRFEIARLHKTLKTTTVYVTHDQMEAMTLADRIVLLNAGRIEQVGTPEEIYERPKTLFVAGFIGTPAMNLLPVTAQRTASGWQLCGFGRSLKFEAGRFDVEDGQKLIMGLRPADILQIDNGAAETSLSGIADMIEFHGDQILVGFPLGETRFSALVPARRRPKEGQAVAFSMNENALHLFDAATGLSIYRAAT
jgi:multiple sugar transport system ATP-binding protein